MFVMCNKIICLLKRANHAQTGPVRPQAGWTKKGGLMLTKVSNKTIKPSQSGEC